MINLSFKKIIPPLFIFVVTLFLCRSFLKPGIPDTHDGHSHLARIANFYLAIRDGHFPIRWAPNLNYKYGYSAFEFYYQTPYILATLFYKIGFSIENSYKASIFLAILIAGTFNYFWLGEIFKKRAALIGSLLYITAPPFILQIFVRGAFGELMAWCLYPVLFFAIHKLVHNLNKNIFDLKFWLLGIFSIFFLILSHLMLSSFGLIFIFLYGLIIVERKKHLSKDFLIKYFSVFVLGLFLSGLFLIPALIETKYVTLSSFALNKAFIDHFVQWQQFIYFPWGYGYSVKGSEDTMSFMLGIGQLILALSCLIFLIYKIFKIKDRQIFRSEKGKLILYFFSCLILALFAMTQFSQPIWNHITYLWQIQFPWRLLVIATLSLSFIGAWFYEKSYSKILAVIIIIYCLTSAFLFAKPGKILHLDDYEYFEFPFTSSVSNEVLPNGFNMYKNIEYKFQVKDLNNCADIQIKTWKTALHEYDIQSTQSAILAERIAYFPGWETYIDGQKTEIIADNPEYPGVMTYNLNSGKHHIKTVYTENTPARKIGDTLSIISIILISVISIKYCLNGNKKH